MFQTRSVRSVARLSCEKRGLFNSLSFLNFSTLYTPARYGQPGIPACSSNELRSSFLNFFRSKGHTVQPSSSSVPTNDPTLLFTSAGMVPFKNIFLGLEPAVNGRTVTTSQRCVRAGGKHNDLDNVGFTSRHHTYFEMLGNFSFGEYFKEDAMRYAWEYLTEVLQLPKDRLKISVFREDDESAKLWERISGFTEESGQIFRMDEADNFWQMGETGPCGPCSEIYWDQLEDVDGERFLEIWNLVFMQYNRDAAGVLHPLAVKCVDTGMGLERLSAVMQGVRNNFDTDTLLQMVNKVLASVESTKTALSKEEQVTAARVIADHVRAVSVLIADGVVPGNSGRGYVLRRIIRRACRYSHQLGFEKPQLHTLVAYITETSLQHADPSITDKVVGIEAMLKQEEESFLVSMTKGLKVISEYISKTTDSTVFPPEIAFQQYDSMGFPFDLTELIVKEQGFTVDMHAVQALMTERRKQSANTWVGSSTDVQVVNEVFGNIKTNNIVSSFVGYDTLKVTTRVLYSHIESSTGYIVLEECPFYATGGGQMGDEGVLFVNGEKVVINTTIKVPDSSIHVLVASIPEQEPLEKYQLLLQASTTVDAIVSKEVRVQSQIHHSSTHLLHHALLQELQTDATPIRQAGSLVHDKLLRFDYTYNKPLTTEQLASIEQRVNEAAKKGHPADICEMTLEQSKQHGVVGLFGEKYNSNAVRVVTLGESKELCGGTHVENVKECYPFIIVSETGVSSGTRRIEALAGPAAVEYLLNCKTNMNQIATHLKISALSAPEWVTKNVVRANQRIEGFLKKIKELEQQQKEQLNMSLSSSDSKYICPGGCVVDMHEVADQQTQVFVYTVPASISDNYAVFRTLAEETAVKQAQASTAPHTVQAFLGMNGKAVIFKVSKDVPFDAKKKGKASDASSVHASSVWKALEQVMQGSKGGGNDVVAQGTMLVPGSATSEEILSLCFNQIKATF